MENKIYVAPAIENILINTQTVLCASNGGTTETLGEETASDLW